MSVTDYIGRKSDVLAWDWAQALNTPQLLIPELALPGGGGKIVAGIGKLGQRFLLELLTEKGTMLHLPDRGTDFMFDLRTGQIRTTLQAEQAFASAVIDIRRNLRSDETEEDPLDERFDSAELDSVTLTQDRLILHISLTSQAGDTRQVLLPISTAPGT